MDHLLGEGPSKPFQGVDIRVVSVGPNNLDLPFLLQPIEDVRAKALCDA